MKLNIKYSALSALVAVTTSAHAATLSGISGTNYADGLISTNGTSVSAFNFGTPAGSPTTINTVDFVTYSAGAGTVSGFTHNGADSNGANGAGDGTTLTNTGVFHGPGTNGNLTYSGLTIGNDYEVQMVFSDTRAFLNPDTMRIWGNATGAGAADFTTADIATAQLVTATFTADATTQDFYLTQDTAVGSFDGYIGAIQLRDVTAVPEPSSTALLGLGGLALILRRRK